jgi:hypothetical protein
MYRVGDILWSDKVSKRPEKSNPLFIGPASQQTQNTMATQSIDDQSMDDYIDPMVILVRMKYFCRFD